MNIKRLSLSITLLVFLTLACSFQPAILSVTGLTASQTVTATPTPVTSPTPTQVGSDQQITPVPSDAASSVPSSSPEPPFPNLNGVWVDNGKEIDIVQNGYSAFASYIEPKMCDDQVGNITPYPYDFSVTLQQVEGVWQLTGKTIVCSYGQDNPNGTGPQETDVRLVLSQDQSSLVGDWYDSLNSDWRIGAVNITRKFINGAPAPTPDGYVPPTHTP